MMVKSGLVFFYFEILLAPSELLLLSAKKAAWKAGNSEGASKLQNKKF